MTPRHRIGRATLAMLAALALALPWAPDAGAEARYRKGDTVTISGRVTNPSGKPLAGVTVLLELSRTSFKLREMRRTKTNTLRIPAITDADGRYRHDWRWDGFYNTFELAAAMPVRTEGGDDFEVLKRVEITQPVGQGSPVETPIVVENTVYLDWLRRFLDGRASSEEKRVFREMGKPDRIDRREGDSWAWWYFEAGKVYRFAGGALEEVETFEPVKEE